MPARATPPKDSGLPRLIIPHRRPCQSVRRFLLTLVLYISSGRATKHLGQRELVLFLNRSSRDSIRKHLYALRDSGFLRRRERRKNQDLLDADVYLPGRVLSPEDVSDWLSLADQLFGPSGLCKGLLGRSAFGTRLLGINGLLVVSALRQSQISLSVAEIHRFLGFFILSETTIRAQLKRAQRAGLVERIGMRWHVTQDFETALELYELTSLAGERLARTRDRFMQERRRFTMGLYGHALTPEQLDQLKETKCIRCGRTNEECKKDYEVELSLEHFPPKTWLRAWQIPDHADFAWVACPPENSRYGALTDNVSIPKLQSLVRLDVRDPIELQRMVAATLQVSLRRSYRALDRRDRICAAHLATSASSLWVAVVAGSIPLHLNTLGSSASSKRLGRRVVRIHTKSLSQGVRWPQASRQLPKRLRVGVRHASHQLSSG